jgi:hypothetical protein
MPVPCRLLLMLCCASLTLSVHCSGQHARGLDTVNATAASSARHQYLQSLVPPVNSTVVVINLVRGPWMHGSLWRRRAPCKELTSTCNDKGVHFCRHGMNQQCPSKCHQQKPLA